MKKRRRPLRMTHVRMNDEYICIMIEPIPSTGEKATAEEKREIKRVSRHVRALVSYLNEQKRLGG